MFLLLTYPVVERSTLSTNLIVRLEDGCVARSGCEPEAGVHDAPLGGHRLPAHVQSARTMHRDVARACRQGECREVESVYPEEPDIGSMRAGNDTELAVLAAGAGHGDSDGETESYPLASRVPTTAAIRLID